MIDAVEFARRAKALTVHAATNLPRAGDALKAGAEWLAAGARLTPDAELAERRAACGACEHWRPMPGVEIHFCGVCRCAEFKLSLATAECPLDKWPKRQ